jgi:enterochelin esterase family protein
MMTPTVRRLRAAARRGEPALQRFLERHRVPIQAEGLTTFVFVGAADRVDLEHWIYGLPGTQPFDHVPGTNLWHLSVDLPAESRIEYKLGITLDGRRSTILDPLNPRLAHDPFGANSVCSTEGYRTPEWAGPDPESRPGSIEQIEIESAALAGRRTLHVYLPARFRPGRRYPLLVVHDGSDYLRYSSLRNVLDNLITRLEVAPLIVALTDPGQRLKEYAANPRHARHITEEVLPLLADHYPLVEDPGGRGLMGASLGAVASLSTAWMHPGTWGRLMLQSGSFAFTDIGQTRRGPEFEPVVTWMNRFRADPGEPADRVYVSSGVYESLIYENRSLVPMLQRAGMQVLFTEARDGHNWENWRDRMRQGLSYLFPGPLWLTYE